MDDSSGGYLKLSGDLQIVYKYYRQSASTPGFEVVAGSGLMVVAGWMVDVSRKFYRVIWILLTIPRVL